MHVEIKGSNTDFAIQMANELDCSVSDYVNSALAAIRESGYVREFKIQLVSKDEPQKKVCKTITMRRRSRSDKYDPLNI